MTKKNTFKYECTECGWTGNFKLREFARASRPRCGGCGSTRLEPATELARDRILTHITAQHEQHRLILQKMS